MTLYEYRKSIVAAKMSPNAKLVLFCLLEYRNSKTNRCYPSIDYLAQEIGLSYNPVAKAIRELEQNKYIKIKKERLKGCRFTSNIYYFPKFDTSEYEVSNDVSSDGSVDASISDDKLYITNKNYKSIKKEKVSKKKKVKINDLTLELLQDWITKNNLDKNLIEKFLDNFKLKCQAKGYKYACYYSAFQTWCNNEKDGGLNRFKINQGREVL